MPAGSPPPGIESSPLPAVSSLRSRFEKLAVESSPLASKKTSSSRGLLSPDASTSRPRASSSSDVHKPDLRTLRPASSSSDLKNSVRRPPPPPPSRNPSPATNALHSVPDPPSHSIPRALPDTETHTKHSLTLRHPPPPPPPHESSISHRISDVASLVSKFGGSTIVPESSPSPDVYLNLTPASSFEGYSEQEINDQGWYSQNSINARPPPLPIRKHDVKHENSFPSHGSEQYSEGTISSSSQSSRSSSECDDTSIDPSLLPPPPTIGLASPVRVSKPPLPPPRLKTSYPPSQTGSAGSSASASASSLNPPALPARKSTMAAGELPQSRRQPSRYRSTYEPDMLTPSDLLNTSASPTIGRKSFGSHPPPPTRTIALGAKLPPPRRSPSGSSSESEEEDLKVKVDLLPDSSRSSRRPPIIQCHNFSEFHIHVPAYTGIVVVSGHIVAVAAHHHLKIYDLSESESPVHNLDTRSMGLEVKSKDFKILSMEFRTAGRSVDDGYCLWLGSKDGHLVELDAVSGAVVGMKLAAHAHPVTHIMRHGRSMITLDNGGKVAIFTSDSSHGSALPLSHAVPRIMRIAEKQEFAKILAGFLWTSTREFNGGAAIGTTSRGPIVRVYDLSSAGSAGKSLLPSEHLGAIISGACLPSQRSKVFLGHEGGHVSIWSTATEDRIPRCEEVVKVSTSDILCLEGVNDRLWAGSRKGTIATYDVVPRPWVITNCWMAHTKLPVLKLAVDVWSIKKLGRLCVYSVGRDERLRFWDGLLGIDWIDQELLKREKEFSSFRDLNVLIVSYNLDSAKPDALTGDDANVNLLTDILKSIDCPDVIAFGLQELIDLESRKMAAKTVLLGAKNKSADGSFSQRVTTSYKKWYDRLILAVRLAMPSDTPYTVIHTENLVGLFSCIFVKNTERISLNNVAITTVKRGMGGRYGNKGGIVARFVIDDSSLCFINCHLAAGQNHVRQRNADIAAILEEKSVFPESSVEEPLAYVNGGEGSMVLDHEIVFMNGDMNYRIDLRRDAVIADIKTGNYAHLFSQDQLAKEIKNNRGFRLRSFIEGPITFAPTYKYDRRSSEYDSSEKRRVPAWCDRILWRSQDPSRVKQLHYRRYEANVSDHRPISSGFRVTIKSVHQEVRGRTKAEVQAVWAEREKELLSIVYRYYSEQAML